MEKNKQEKINKIKESMFGTTAERWYWAIIGVGVIVAGILLMK